MGRRKTQINNQNFSGGFVTEVNSINTAPNTYKILENFVVGNDGSAQRRLGLKSENSSNTITHPITIEVPSTLQAAKNKSISTYLWRNADNDPNSNFTVVQVGQVLYFFDAGKDILLDNLKGSIFVPSELRAYKTSFGDVAYIPVVLPALDMTSVDGKLICAGDNYNILEVVYNKSAGSFGYNVRYLKVRDIWGVNDSLDVNERPTTLTDKHKYNLINQGWSNSKITSFYTSQSKYPSNADLAQLGKKSDGSWDASLVSSEFTGRTPAPKGRIILHYTKRGVIRKHVNTETGAPNFDVLSGITTPTIPDLPGDEEQGGVTSVARFGQRLFFSGVVSDIVEGDSNSPNYTGAVFFSKVIQKDSDMYECYQEADPTSDIDSDLVDSDGGYIKVSGAGKIFKMIPIGGYLVLFADNGVWAITSPDENFTATNFSVIHLSDVKAVARDNIVPIEDKILFLSKEGIYAVFFAPETQRLAVQNISDPVIKTFLDDIQVTAKETSIGKYDSASKKVHWLLNDTDTYDSLDGYNFNLELILDLKVNIFYVNRYEASSSVFLIGIAEKLNTNIEEVAFPVTTTSGGIVTSGGQTVTTTETVRSRGKNSIKYLIMENPGPSPSDSYITIGDHSDKSFKDFGLYDAKAVAQTNNYTFDDIFRRKMSPFFGISMKRTETGFQDDGSGNLTPTDQSSCLVTPIFDYADTTASNKIGKQFQAYRYRRLYIPSGPADTYEYGQNTIVTKSRVRGTGKSIAFKFESEPEKDMYIYGWGIIVEGETDE